ncbi:unnamed protein product [Mytilus edulis]|uniref:Neurotransmitter-gated ion-channel ligand-binding domain-containing protein n=1 Tax=Mytilus edulis TaxID=6550 RepID=A0A8S3RXV6_MYTED|nr:unnamed protein product [Mytilus edulis]
MLSTYDKRFPPHYNDVIPVKVKVQMYVLSVFEIDASEMTFSISMFLRQEWVDRRLQFDTKENLSNISLDNEITKEIWVPDLAFTSDTHTYFHELTRPNRLMIIYPNGKVVYSIRVTGKFTCFMDLTKFPFDEQRCPIELESYGFTNSIISFQWTEPAAAFRDGVKHSQFELGETQSYTRNLTYSTADYYDQSECHHDLDMSVLFHGLIKINLLNKIFENNFCNKNGEDSNDVRRINISDWFI